MSGKLEVLDGQVSVTTADECQYLGSSSWMRELPVSFKVVALEQDGGQIVLRSSDGREIRATPGQLDVRGTPLSSELDPDHQAHLEAELSGLPSAPADDVDDPTLTATLHDDRLGAVEFKHPYMHCFEATARTSLGPAIFYLYGGLETMVPLAHRLLDQLPQLLDTAVRFLWEWGAEGDETAEFREEFFAGFRIGWLSVYQSGVFSISPETDRRDLFGDDGYWPEVHFLPSGQAVLVTVEG